jgi:hypothetical protein
MERATLVSLSADSGPRELKTHLKLNSSDDELQLGYQNAHATTTSGSLMLP